MNINSEAKLKTTTHPCEAISIEQVMNQDNSESSSSTVNFEDAKANVIKVLQLLDEKKCQEALERLIIPILRSENRQCASALISNKIILRHIESFIDFHFDRLKAKSIEQCEVNSEKQALLNFVTLFQKKLESTSIVAKAMTCLKWNE